jgi:hypothetical protein
MSRELYRLSECIESFLHRGKLVEFTLYGAPVIYLTKNYDFLCAACANERLIDNDADNKPVFAGPVENGTYIECDGDCNDAIDTK